MKYGPQTAVNQPVMAWISIRWCDASSENNWPHSSKAPDLRAKLAVSILCPHLVMESNRNCYHHRLHHPGVSPHHVHRQGFLQSSVPQPLLLAARLLSLEPSLTRLTRRCPASVAPPLHPTPLLQSTPTPPNRAEQSHSHLSRPVEAFGGPHTLPHQPLWPGRLPHPQNKL